jgi:hypothetical protein
MQVPSANIGVPAVTPVTATTLAQVIAGDLAALPIGRLVPATVTSIAPGQATLDWNGQAFSIRTRESDRPAAPALERGDVILVRVPAGTTRTLELVRPVSTEAPPTSPPRIAVVDVLSALPDRRLLVRIDNRDDATVRAPGLAPNGRYVLEIQQTSAGITVRPPADSADLPAMVAGAILRAARPPDLGSEVAPLLAELTRLIERRPGEPVPQAATSTARPPVQVPAPIREAAAAARETLAALIPNTGRPPAASELRNLVDNAGMHYEARLARLEPDSDARDVARSDLKGGLLRLLQTASALGASDAIPTVHRVVDGIEVQQATNVLAQAQGTPLMLQIPFPDAEKWRTLNLAIERDAHGEQSEYGRPGEFRMLMHVPLSELGETWIDAGLIGDRFRAILYLERSSVRERVRGELTDLRAELQSNGLSEVLLDVRSAADLPPRQRRLSHAMLAGRPDSVSVLDVRA